ncbi:MAG TPA: ABC transporter substrate-binding protein [Acidimicrobiia bacterium]|nr:ABC transporter substrate-binding protein [Acidimicrobiia bacterium]
MRRNRFGWTQLVGAGLALALIASACGSSGSSGNKNNNKGPATTVGLSTGETGGTPVPGGSLTYGLEADTTGGWCLYLAQLAIGGIEVARTIYDTLTVPGADGKIHPFLAESVTPDATYKKWTIKLRPNIKFTDGSALTATVVKDNLDKYRLQNPLFTFVFKDVKSVDLVPGDDLSLTVTTTVPWVAFPWFLWSSYRLGIMAEAQMNSKQCNTKLIGTGPFMKQSWTPNESFVAVKNPNYWYHDPTTGAQLPYLDKITFVPQEDGPKRLAALEAGDFQAIQTDDAPSIVKIRDDVKNGSLATTESGEYPELSYVMLNNTKPPFDHLSARQAVAYAIDRDQYNQVINHGILQNASGPFGPGVVGYVADTGLPTIDPAKAKAAAAQYKSETGQDLSFTLYHTADTTTTKAAQVIQQMLRNNAGIKISLNPVSDQSTYINDAIAKQEQAILWRNHPGADPDTQYVWFHCGNTPPAACDNIVNFAGFNDPVINKDFDQARSEPDEAKRAALYEDINRQFAKNLYDLWGQWVLWTVPHKPTVHGILGPNNPDKSGPYPGLAVGNSVTGIWCSGGKC